MRRLNRKTIILLSIPLIVFILCALYIFTNSKPQHLSEAEEQEALAKILGREPVLKAGPTGSLIYDGKYASFNFPARAKVYKYEDPGFKKLTSMVEHFSFDLQNPRLVLNYTVEKAPSANSHFDDFPSYKLRNNPKYGYKKSTFKVSNSLGEAFEKEGDSQVKSEKTGFLLHNGLFFSISVSGNNIYDASDLFSKLTNTFEFKE